ncbi:MAG: molybdopterin molybdotransferase MoeA [Elusimicrobia bacterium]|nr:molybdopterin molybdotransferase MoeA [Elusimicrobiota bacterium]
MISFDEALRIVRANAVALGTETVSLGRGLGRVLRQDVASDTAMPPFDKSAMDGFACRRADLAGALEVVETIPAGRRPRRAVGPGQCAKIMTGAMMPEGADCVVIVEETAPLPDGRVRWQGASSADNVCRKGSDVAAGDRLVAAGTRITPKVVASLALAGCVEPRVSLRPRVGVIATGSEIVDPAAIPLVPQIRDTNSLQALAQAEQAGCDARSYGIVQDDADAITAVIDRAAGERDLLLITGGVSMGDFDLVPGRLKRCGFTILFDKVAVQPGKPTLFARRGDVRVFGMPGNPVSAFITFEFFVKELLAGMTGASERPSSSRCPLAREYRRRRADRLARVPVRLTPEGTVEAVEYHGSAHITSLAGADGLIAVPAGVDWIPKDTLVDVRQI